MTLNTLGFSTDNILIFEKVVDGSEKKYAKIEMFRTGVFEHRYYGRLNIDRAYLATMVRNWKNKVHTTQVSFDLDHDHTSGAMGWLPLPEDMPNALSIKRKTYKDSTGKVRHADVLVGIVELTEAGYDQIKNNKRKYFSAEIDPNFQSYEKFYETDRNGQVKEEESKKYGPTIKGGAFTNFPFIIGMEPISLSFSSIETHTNEELYSSMFAGGFEKDRLMIFSSKSEEMEAEYSEISDNDPVVEKNQEIDDNSENKNEYSSESTRSEPVLPEPAANIAKTNEKSESHMNLSEILASLAGKTTAEKVALLNAATLSFADASPEKLVLSEMLATQNALAQKETEVQTEMQRRIARDKEVEQLKLTNADLALKAEENKQLAYATRVEVFCQNLEKDKHHQSVINAANTLLANVSASQRDHVFSLVDGDKTEDVDLFSIVKTLLDALPEDARFSDKQEFSANADGQTQKTETPANEAKEEKKEDKFDKFFSLYPAYKVDEAEIRSDRRWEDMIDDNGKLKPIGG